MNFTFVVELGTSKLRIVGTAGDTATLWFWSESENKWNLISGEIKLAEIRTLDMALNMSCDALVKHTCSNENEEESCEEDSED